MFWVCIVSKQGQCSRLAEKPEGNWCSRFGKHDNRRTASVSWCGILQDPNTYKHKSLPHGKDLQDEHLQKDLSTVVEIFVKNAEKLAPLGSSQASESLNNLVDAKHPRFVIMGPVRVMTIELLVLLDRRTLNIHMFQRYLVIIGNFFC